MNFLLCILALSREFALIDKSTQTIIRGLQLSVWIVVGQRATNLQVKKTASIYILQRKKRKE